jgi:hypothetical protein
LSGWQWFRGRVNPETGVSGKRAVTAPEIDSESNNEDGRSTREEERAGGNDELIVMGGSTA